MLTIKFKGIILLTMDYGVKLLKQNYHKSVKCCVCSMWMREDNLKSRCVQVRASVWMKKNGNEWKWIKNEWKWMEMNENE